MALLLKAMLAEPKCQCSVHIS